MSEQTRTEFEQEVWEFIRKTIRQFIAHAENSEVIGGKEGVVLRRHADAWCDQGRVEEVKVGDN